MNKQKILNLLPRHTRKRNRLVGYDYAQDGYYFVTICVIGRQEIFGQIKNEKMILNEYGRIVHNQWLWLEKQYPYIKLDQYVIMSNHVHGIILLNSENINSVGTGRAEINVGTGRDLSLRGIKIKSLSNLVGAFKTTSSKLIRINGLSEFAWQRSFYDHIIRNHKSLQNIRRYIYYNPARWDSDRNNPENLYM
jgi:REP element-mobilizing transposase RayT